jgi:hypothetical protein
MYLGGGIGILLCACCIILVMITLI